MKSSFYEISHENLFNSVFHRKIIFSLRASATVSSQSTELFQKKNFQFIFSFCEQIFIFFLWQNWRIQPNNQNFSSFVNIFSDFITINFLISSVFHHFFDQNFHLNNFLGFSFFSIILSAFLFFIFFLCQKVISARLNRIFQWFLKYNFHYFLSGTRKLFHQLFFSQTQKITVSIKKVFLFIFLFDITKKKEENFLPEVLWRTIFMIFMILWFFFVVSSKIFLSRNEQMEIFNS